MLTSKFLRKLEKTSEKKNKKKSIETKHEQHDKATKYKTVRT